MGAFGNGIRNAMFEKLSDNLTNIFSRLSGRGRLSEGHIREALAEIRTILLEADVALPVVKEMLASIGERAKGEEVLRSVKPSEMVVKIVHDALIEVLGEAAPLSLNHAPPVPILLVGLQGAGKTTTTAKLARKLAGEKKKCLLVSLDIYRPAAREQLQILAEEIGVDSLAIVEAEKPAAIAKRALSEAKAGGFDIVLFDSAGRSHIDAEMMAELVEMERIIKPHETLLIADGLTGQDAVRLAKSFHETLTLTGIILTRMDGDGRGGAALSMRHVTGLAIKYMGVGEKTDALEGFDPKRIAGRILGQGDIVSLVEKASETMEEEKAEKIAAKMKKGQFDLDDLREQLLQMGRMGGIGAVLSMMPGIGKLKKQIEGKMDDKLVARQIAIIGSMTPMERTQPKLLNAKRKMRVANGSGTSVQEVNKILKMHGAMAMMMKKMKKGGMGGLSALMDGAPNGEMPNLNPNQIPPFMRK